MCEDEDDVVALLLPNKPVIINPIIRNVDEQNDNSILRRSELRVLLAVALAAAVAMAAVVDSCSDLWVQAPARPDVELAMRIAVRPTLLAIADFEVVEVEFEDPVAPAPVDDELASDAVVLTIGAGVEAFSTSTSFPALLLIRCTTLTILSKYFRFDFDAGVAGEDDVDVVPVGIVGGLYSITIADITNRTRETICNADCLFFISI